MDKEAIIEQVNNLISDEEFCDILHSALWEYEFSEWMKEEVIGFYDEAVISLEPKDLVPLATDYANNYLDEVHESYLFSEIPREVFRIVLIWAIANNMRKSVIERDARVRADAASYEVDRSERSHEYDRVYARESDRPLHMDETLETILNSSFRESMGVQR